MEEKVNGLVISSVNYGENDRILTIFTPEKGSICAKIRGVKKAGAKLRFASEPFCFAEFILFKKGEMYSVTGATNIDSFYPVREDIVKFFCGGSILEFVKKFSMENLDDGNLFFRVISALKDLAYTDKNPKEILIKFLIDGLNLVGYGLNLKGCAKCCKKIEKRVFFDYTSGGFYCEDCYGGVGREVKLSTFHTLCKIDSGEKDLGSQAEYGDNLKYALKLIEYYIENKADEKLKSLTELLLL